MTVTLDVASSTSIDGATGCSSGSSGVTSFGSIPAGTKYVSSGTCTIEFGSTNDTSMLLAYQSDQGGVAGWSPTVGDLDTSFSSGDGSDGVAYVDFAGNADVADDIAVMDDGRIVLGGYTDGGSHNMAAARLLADGTPDNSFNTNGRSEISFAAGDDDAWAADVQSDDKVVLCGSTAGGARMSLMRMTAGGLIDNSFGGTGKVQPTFNNTDWCGDVIAMDDGRILAVGGTWDTVDNDIAVARLLSDGQLDPDFGTGGRYVLDYESANEREAAEAAAIQPDGKIVVVAHSEFYGDVLVARLNENGTVDNSFGGGWARFDMGGGVDEVAAVRLQEDGKVVIFGFTDAAGNDDMYVARLLATGGFDPSFGGGNGYVAIPVGSGNDKALDGIIQPDGSYLIAGTAYGANDDVAVARVLEDGTLDDSFGTAGIATYDLSGASDTGRALAFTRDGRLLVAGTAANATSDMMVFQLDQLDQFDDYADGSTDWDAGRSTFGACLDGVGLGATVDVDTWVTTGSCTSVDTDPWNAIAPDATDPSAVIAKAPTSVDTAVAQIRFGVRTAADQQTGRYMAPITFETVAPSL
ncbi:MAG: hypothetical protein KDC46_11570 [Thermoleophilia bacterium]|nr:hypothetical protein [Thermoleophilia bacterium]